jgi:transcriptional regulator with XRE-family HTH domain
VSTIAAPTSAPVFYSQDFAGVTLLVPGLLTDEGFGTSDHVGFAASCRVVPDIGSHTQFASGRSTLKALATEVKRLRDLVAEVGLTRQEIAVAIGVDRRSLSGFVRGEIQPTDARLRALRVLAETAAWSVGEFGEHAREVLRGAGPDPSPLALIAKGRTDVRRELRSAAERAGLRSAALVETSERRTKDPLYIKAAAAWAGKGLLPTRQGVLRTEANYEQDLAKAAAAITAPARPRRQGI